MNSKHVIEILENAPLRSLSENEKAVVEAHAKECASCDQAYRAARLSALVINERIRTPIEPSPFFQTRVMAAWREKQALESVPGWARLWKSTRALVSSMAVTTAALGVLSFVLPATPATLDETTPVYSAESVIMGQQQSDDQISYEQVLNTIYNDSNDDDAR
jgi:hypothetical protein